MFDQAFDTLDFPRLRDLISRSAQTAMGRARFANLVPFDEPETLRQALRAISEAILLEQRIGGRWSFSELADPTDALALLRIEGAGLEPLTLLELARLCDQALAARALLINERDSCPVLWSIVAELPSRELHSLVARITSKILPSGELDDRASPELSRIRSEINRLRSQITRSLESLMRRSDESIQDEIVTVRNDRFVIPVRSDHRGRIKGVAHGSSSSGATVFIEPIETIESNNELQALRETEMREITRILFSLAEEMRRELHGIELAAHAVEELDFIGAKASFARRFQCIVPEIAENNVLELSKARHPLLEENLRELGRSVVPVSFTLDETHQVMVISGANAGGKTVVLKTAGLLSLMALSGLPVPANSARIPFYRSVLADVGDQQSLAANLSTFTAHVSNISRMIEMCRSPALVLLDEVGTGTDPDEGSALGVAVVDHFRHSCHAHVIATTHYSGLKIYATNEDDVLNASVEFDEKTLQPTYRLLVGLAGSSSGIEIARRFGFPDEIVRNAAAHVGSSAREAANYLQRIKREAEDAEALRRALDEEREAVAEKYARLDVEARNRERERESAFEKQLRSTVQDFERRSKELVEQIQDRAERIRVERETQRRVSELKREAQAAAKSASTMSVTGERRAEPQPAGGIRVVRDGKVLEKRQQDSPEDEEIISAPPSRPIEKGDQVRLKSFGSIGLVDSIAGENAEVRVGSIRLREKLSNLELIEKPVVAPVEGRAARLRGSKGSEFKLRESTSDIQSELKLIGRTTDEAVDETDKFLDEAFMNGIQHLRIIHGHGTGALRRVIHNLLKNHPHVAQYSQAPPDQGGAGATIVELKQ
jgi:DNA mismatch repair protein MutS2